MSCAQDSLSKVRKMPSVRGQENEIQTIDSAHSAMRVATRGYPTRSSGFRGFFFSCRLLKEQHLTQK